jgi:hypothetical protein
MTIQTIDTSFIESSKNRQELQAAKPLTILRIVEESTQYWRPRLSDSKACGHLRSERHSKTTAHLVFCALLDMICKILDSFFVAIVWQQYIYLA